MTELVVASPSRPASAHDNVTPAACATAVCAQGAVQFDGKLFYGRAMKLLLIQGANMEYLGRRQPELYGTTTARELDTLLRRRARELGVGLDILYTNTEGEAVSAIFK